MSKISREVKKNEKTIKNKSVINYMNGISYELTPLETLKMVTASSIFGEPSYYVKEGLKHEPRYIKDSLFAAYNILSDNFVNQTTSEIMEIVIDDALSYDFKATLEWAVTLRYEYNMRLNPQVIMVRAAIHPNRQLFTNENPGMFNKVNDLIMKRADEPAVQIAYYLYINKSKNNIPGILKKSWKKKYEKMNAYSINKYKNAEIGMIDAIRICHANSDLINELMTTGKVKVSENTKTWEQYRSSGRSWKEILDSIELGHMALLRNLNNIFSEIDDKEICEKYLNKLKDGVLAGKQFPFRYKNAYDMIKNSNVHNKMMILKALEDCIDISLGNLPDLPGKTMCLSDNSGSAWNGFPSEYGRQVVATIGNLSSVLIAKKSEEGHVGVFGDELITRTISKEKGVFSSTNLINKLGQEVGMSTEGGIWKFFYRAITKKEHWDNIVIFSDMQAGYGQLYGTRKDQELYLKLGFACGGNIDIPKLIKEYRKINPKVNVYCVQTAGYKNVLIPEYGYRTNILYGWTGKELQYIETMNRFWDEVDKKTEKKDE